MAQVDEAHLADIDGKVSAPDLDCLKIPVVIWLSRAYERSGSVGAEIEHRDTGKGVVGDLPRSGPLCRGRAALQALAGDQGEGPGVEIYHESQLPRNRRLQHQQRSTSLRAMTASGQKRTLMVVVSYVRFRG